MTDHPILFQPNMIETLHAGRKTQTRRGINSKNTFIDGHGWRRGEIDQMDWGEAWLNNGPEAWVKNKWVLAYSFEVEL